MKVIVLGDTHGYDTWKKVIEQNTYDKIVFIGDYFDSQRIIGPQQLINFKEVVEFKLANPDKVVLLFGNHDYHYLNTVHEKYSGFQPHQKFDFSEALHAAIDKDAIQMCYIHEKFLMTHAGVTKTWCTANEIDENNIEQSINDLFKYNPNVFRFTTGVNFDPYGDDVCQSPIWVRPKSLMRDKINHYTQIIGHTTVRAIQDLNMGIILIDAMAVHEFAVIEDGVFKVGKIA